MEYFGSKKHFEVLPSGENEKLYNQWLSCPDTTKANQLRQQLVQHNMKLVFKIANEYFSNSSSSFADLVQEGAFGMLKGVESRKFDSTLSSFSTWIGKWIRAYILKFIINNHSLIKIGKNKSERKLFWQFKKEKSRLEKLGISFDPEKISKSLNVNKSDVEEFEIRWGGEVYDAVLEEIGDAFNDLHPDKLFEKEEYRNSIKKRVDSFVNVLNDKQKAVFYRRFMTDNPLTLEDLGTVLGVSKQRVKQIEDEVKIKVVKYLKEFR